MEAGMKCIKYLLFLFNFLFVVIGAVLIGVGVSAKYGWDNKYLSFIKTGNLSTPPNLFIAVGVFIFIIAFFGCCGAIKENHCMIMTYSVLVGLILVLELAGAFAAFALKDDVKILMEDGLNSTQQLYANNTDIAKSWDLMQQHLHCCGVHEYKDWAGKIAPGVNVTDIPQSCCIIDHFECSKDVHPNSTQELASKYIFTEGCLDKAVEDIAIGGLGIIGLVLAGIELLGVICACFLARSIRYSYETV